jgi:hypothetical protein
VPATEAVFDERTLRWAAGTELHPWRRTWIYGEYGLSGGPTVVYDVIPTTTTSARKTGAGGGQGGDGQGDGQGGDGKCGKHQGCKRAQEHRFHPNTLRVAQAE